MARGVIGGLWLAAVAFLAWCTTAGAVPGDFVSAQYRDGTLPPIQIRAVGGGEVFLEARVDEQGGVHEVTVLRATPPFTEPVVSAVRSWRLTPAEDDWYASPGEGLHVHEPRAVASAVLVAAVFRGPTLNAPTLGESPRDVAVPSGESPFPISTAIPPYPPNALADGVVLTEVRVGFDGRVEAVRVVRSAPPFDDASVKAARGWVFRPGRVRGRLVTTLAYIVFAFRQPVTGR